MPAVCVSTNGGSRDGAGFHFLALAEQVSCHDDALHLVRAFIDLGDLRIAHHAFHRKVLGIAVATEELHGIVRDLHGDIGGEALGCGAEECEVGVTPL